jgi:hypothetical protein
MGRGKIGKGGSRPIQNVIFGFGLIRLYQIFSLFLRQIIFFFPGLVPALPA